MFGFFARFASIEIGFETILFQYYEPLWDILASSTYLKKLTLRNGKELEGTFFCETEGRLYYASEDPRRLVWICKPFKYLNSVLDKKVQKLLSFPKMRPWVPNKMFGNEFKLPREGSALPNVAKCLHAALGGELWVYGKKWMEDGEQVDGLDKVIEQAVVEIEDLKLKHLEAIVAWEEEKERRDPESVRLLGTLLAV